MPSWTPLLVQTILGIAVLLGSGLVLLSQWRWRSTQELEALARVRLARIEVLEEELDRCGADLKAANTAIASLQRLNFELQEARHRQRSVRPSSERDKEGG